MHRWREGPVGYLGQQYGFGYGRIDIVAKHPGRVSGDAVSPWPMMLHAPATAVAVALYVVALVATAIGVSRALPATGATAILLVLAIERLVAEVRAHLPEVRAALRARFDAKLAELKLPLEPGRTEQEVVLQVQRMDVDEELDRLTAHVDEARRVFGLGEAVGRRLDFLMQEFNREANTLGSKSADPRTTNAAVELKVLIEQMREQVQNLE